VATLGAGAIELVAEASAVEAGGLDGGALGDAVAPQADTMITMPARAANKRFLNMASPFCGAGSSWSRLSGAN